MERTLYALLILITYSTADVTDVPNVESIHDPIEIIPEDWSSKLVDELIDDETRENLTNLIDSKWQHINELVQKSRISESAKADILSKSNLFASYMTMKLNRRQFRVISDNMDKLIKFVNSRGSRARMAAPNFEEIPAKRWTEMPIKYVTTEIRNTTLRSIIDAALDQLNKDSNNCVSFTKVNKIPDGPHLLFTQSSKFKSCGRSPLGRQYYGNNILINPKCKNSFGIIMHEVLHSLGFDHTQTRPDRDQYIVVDDDNILKNQKHNFRITDHILIDQIPYDYESIMHYSARAFANNTNKNTMTPIINATYYLGRMMRLKKNLSRQDVKTLQHIYCDSIKSKARPCFDTILTCASLKPEVCKVKPKYFHQYYVTRACPSTCHLCDYFPPNDPGTVRTCYNFDSECDKMVQNNDCISTNLSIRTSAHVMCPQACNVCASNAPFEQRNCQLAWRREKNGILGFKQLPCRLDRNRSLILAGKLTNQTEQYNGFEVSLFNGDKYLIFRIKMRTDTQVIDLWSFNEPFGEVSKNTTLSTSLRAGNDIELEMNIVGNEYKITINRKLAEAIKFNEDWGFPLYVTTHGDIIIEELRFKNNSA